MLHEENQDKAKRVKDKLPHEGMCQSACTQYLIAAELVILSGDASVLENAKSSVGLILNQLYLLGGITKALK